MKKKVVENHENLSLCKSGYIAKIVDRLQILRKSRKTALHMNVNS